MAHTYISDLAHCVFSTKLRRNSIPAEVQPDLWAFVGGIARKNGFKALIVGGTENHCHVLLSLPATIALAKAVQLLKGASSHWMNETHGQGFAWQEGYGAFTVGISQKDDTIAYIQSCLSEDFILHASQRIVSTAELFARTIHPEVR